MRTFIFSAFLIGVCNSFFTVNNILFRPHSFRLNVIRPNYPFSKKYYETYLKRLNSKNITIQNEEVLGNDDAFTNHTELNETFPIGYRIVINKGLFAGFNNAFNFENQEEPEDDDDYFRRTRGGGGGSGSGSRSKKSDNFEVVTKSPISFKDIGGYDAIKMELTQCVDMLQNYTKYIPYNVRIPKGIIFEGPPGNGKTLLAKAFAGETNCGFIAVSGAEFQEKYVGVGSAKIRELFQLAKKNIPCIIFIDEIDALGRSRGRDGETASAERDNTLNELLVALDGFKNSSGIFVIGATNRADLLDSALLRPGRIDKRIFIGNPDEKTRQAIIKIHLYGKPHNDDISEKDLVQLTAGFSGAQIENILNEAMLNALRYNRNEFTKEDLEVVYNKILVGWQPTDHVFTKDIIDHIAIHEMGHAIVGLLSKHHTKVQKIVINLSAPNSPGYTVFENSNSNIYTREALFEHLTILLAGRVAEEIFYGISVTTGALNDFEEALKLANKMIMYYGMGTMMIYPDNSEKYKEMIDTEISELLEEAYQYATFIIENSKNLIAETAELLKEKKTIDASEIIEIINEKYSDVFELHID